MEVQGLHSRMAGFVPARSCDALRPGPPWSLAWPGLITNEAHIGPMATWLAPRPARGLAPASLIWHGTASNLTQRTGSSGSAARSWLGDITELRPSLRRFGKDSMLRLSSVIPHTSEVWLRCPGPGRLSGHPSPGTEHAQAPAPCVGCCQRT